jgi:hypothetical protein
LTKKVPIGSSWLSGRAQSSCASVIRVARGRCLPAWIPGGGRSSGGYVSLADHPLLGAQALALVASALAFKQQRQEPGERDSAECDLHLSLPFLLQLWAHHQTAARLRVSHLASSHSSFEHLRRRPSGWRTDRGRGADCSIYRLATSREPEAGRQVDIELRAGIDELPVGVPLPVRDDDTRSGYSSLRRALRHRSHSSTAYSSPRGKCSSKY